MTMLTVGKAAEAAGMSAKMLRNYDEMGLVKPSVRAESGYRYYNEADLHSLRFVARARSLGFSLEQTAKLLALWRDRRRNSAEVKALASSHIEALDRKIAELQTMRKTLAHLAHHCHGDHRPDCPILDDLAKS